MLSAVNAANNGTCGTTVKCRGIQIGQWTRVAAAVL